ncbi:BnaC02g24830D [Brassica napus]|uniref:BnaC02g24830D protein n=1 Tax=Brassica napus TaxID=3708 RepID=A0A078FJN0_BRANA|nr:BnaC02g24830D [Brassica napus]
MDAFDAIPDPVGHRHSEQSPRAWCGRSAR